MKKRFLALFIVIVMLLSNISVFATATNQTPVLDETDVSTAVDDFDSVYSNDGLDELIVLGEITELREANVKHFKLSNGLNKAVAYSHPVHYMNENGDWIDINNYLVLQGNEYSTDNKFEIKFANKSGSNGLLSIKDGDYKIDFTPINTNKVNVVIENPQESNSHKFNDVKTLRNLVSKATYSNIYNGIDIEYILTGNNIKENIIVNSQHDSYVYTFELKLNKLTAELSNGSIVLSDSTSGEKMYVIPAPYMYDANGVMSTDVEYSLAQNSKRKYTFTVTANTEWINADERAFPVIIDPTIIGDIVDADRDVTSDGMDTSTQPNMIIGNFFDVDIPAFLKFNTLPNIQEGTYLVQVTFAMNASTIYNDDDLDFYVGVFRATKDWISDSTFNYETSSTYYNGTPENSVQITETGPYEWDITSLYKQWKSGTANHGICVKAVNLAADASAAVIFCSLESGNIAPQLELTYTEPNGVEDYYGMLITPIGESGVGYVNLYNGDLTFINNLTTIETPGLEYEINMVYNSIDSKWTPSFNERIELFEHSDDVMRDDIVRYIWHDPDGTMHYFTPYLQKNWLGDYIQYVQVSNGYLWSTDDPDVFYPEDDIDYVLIKASNGDFILQNYDGTQKYFNSDGNLLKICDAQGNVLFLSYENGNVSFIDCKTHDNELIAQASFLYENNKLIYAYNYSNKLEISLSWDDVGLSEVEYNYAGNATDNTINIYYIENSNMIEKIIDAVALKYVNYNVNTNGIISEVKVYNNNDVLQSQNNIIYNSNSTVCTYSGTNINSSADDSTVAYTFDEKGRNAATTYDDSILPDDKYYDIEYSQNIYDQGGNLIKYDMETEEKDFFNVTEQNINFDLSDITTNDEFPAEGNSRDMVCKVIVNNSDGTISHNTGFLVGPNTLIMSAHGILEDTTDDGILNFSFPTNITVTPGCNKNNQPAPYGNFQVTSCFIQKEYYYLQDENSPERFQYDWAVCTLNENIGNQLGWFDLIVPEESIIEQYALVCGYRGTSVLLRRVTGRIIEFQGESVIHFANTVAGMSGGPTFLCNADYMVFGIHVAEGENACARRIDPLIYTLVSNLNSVE